MTFFGGSIANGPVFYHKNSLKFGFGCNIQGANNTGIKGQDKASRASWTLDAKGLGFDT